VHHVGILYDQIMMHGQRNIKLRASTKQDSSFLSWKGFFFLLCGN